MPDKKNEEKTQAHEEGDPNAIVKLPVRSTANAGKTVKSRWGRIDFAPDGSAEIEVPAKDVANVNDLGWLTPDQAEEFLGIVPNASPQDPVLSQALAAGARLAQDNIQLQEAIALGGAEFERRFHVYQQATGVEISALRERTAVLEHQLRLVGATPQEDTTRSRDELMQRQSRLSVDRGNYNDERAVNIDDPRRKSPRVEDHQPLTSPDFPASSRVEDHKVQTSPDFPSQANNPGVISPDPSAHQTKIERAPDDAPQLADPPSPPGPSQVKTEDTVSKNDKDKASKKNSR